jgi:hypothetical protein
MSTLRRYRKDRLAELRHCDGERLFVPFKPLARSPARRRLGLSSPSLRRRAGPVGPATRFPPCVGMALAKSAYAVPTSTRLVALVSEHAALRAVVTGGTR